jgi:hypothetical protein
VPERVVRHSRGLRTAGTRRDEHRVGLECGETFEVERVVAVHERLRAELTQILHEVVDEGVVVVDDDHAGTHAQRR